MFFKKKIPKWKKEVMEDKRILDAMKESYLQEQIKIAKVQGKKEAKKDTEKKTLSQQIKDFFPASKDNKKPSAFVDYMKALGEQSTGKDGFFEMDGLKKKQKKVEIYDQ